MHISGGEPAIMRHSAYVAVVSCSLVLVEAWKSSSLIMLECGE